MTALGYYQSSLDLHKKINLPLFHGLTLLNAGFALKDQAWFDEALSSFNAGLKKLKGDDNAEARAVAYVGLCEVFSKKGELNDAFKSCSVALQLYRKLRRSPGEAITLDLIRSVYASAGTA